MTDTNVTAVAGQLMRAVVRSGVIRQQDAAVAAHIMREELKALLFGEKYADERALIVTNGHADGLVFASLVAECVRRILAERDAQVAA